MAEPVPAPAPAPLDDATAGPAPAVEASPRRLRSTLRTCALAVAVTLAALLLVQGFLLRMFHVPSTSMEPTLAPGDRVAVSLLTPGPLELRRGDVVVFQDALAWLGGSEAEWADPLHALAGAVGLGDGTSHLAKRVVGLPGDRVQWRPGWDHVRVNGVDVDEPYLAEGLAGEGEAFDVTVPAGRLWVLGDHRAASQDSRQHRDGPGAGFVAVDDVVGRVEAVVWPLDRIGGAGSGEGAFAEVPDAAPEAGA